MRDAGLELEEEVPVLRIVTRPLDVGARKAANRVHRVPEGDEEEMGLVADRAAQHLDPAVPRRSAAVLYAGVSEIGRVVVGSRGRRRPVPHAGDEGAVRGEAMPVHADRAGTVSASSTAAVSTIVANSPFSSTRATACTSSARWRRPSGPPSVRSKVAVASETTYVLNPRFAAIRAVVDTQ